MVRQSIDRSSIAQAAYTLANQQGLAKLSIRSVAESCGVSVGSIYNYFPTKDDLLIEVVGTFWRNAFYEDFCRASEGERFDQFVERLYCSLVQALAKFRSDWLPQIGALSMQGRDAGKMRESKAFVHMRQGLRAVLDADDHVNLLKCSINPDDLVAFVLESMLGGLSAGEPECRVLCALLRASLYETLNEESTG